MFAILFSELQNINLQLQVINMQFREEKPELWDINNWETKKKSDMR